MSLEGTILRIERSSIHDGEGLRTVIFLKGCPLRCAWCSTPEGQAEGIESAGEKIYGTVMTVEELMAEIVKDEVFYFHSNGGITLSGGEPLLQADFAANVLRRAQKLGINTAMESSMCFPFSELEKVLPYLNTLFADLKHSDAEQHRGLVGIDNHLIMDNIRRTAETDYPLELIVRIPLIPGVNDDDKTMNEMGEFLASLRHLSAVELLPYHRLGVSTYNKLGMDYSLPNVKIPSSSHMKAKRDIIGRYVETVR
ncbi:MAG TPA: glycyl-radical enzyme activating protein [Bacillota bacterium]|nr:glycyl-radical enzyme activating protein [Bacillota bacterium]